MSISAARDRHRWQGDGIGKRGVAVALEAKDRPAVAQAPRPSSPTADAAKPPVVAAVPQAPAAAPVAPATKEAELRIETMQPEAGGGLFISGRPRRARASASS